MRTYVPRPAILTLLLLTAACPAAEGIDKAFGKQAEVIGRELNGIREAWAASLARFAAARGNDAPVRAIHFTLTKAAFGGDLHLLGVHDGRRWVAFDAWLPARSAVLEVLDARKLRTADGAIAGRVTVRIPKELFLEAKTDATETYILDLEPDGNAVSGNYRTESAAVRKPRNASAELESVGEGFALPEGFPDATPNASNPFDLYPACVAMEGELARRYAQVLRCETILRGHPAAAAPRRRAPTRPDFQPGTEEGKKDAPPAGPSLDDIGGLDDDLGGPEVATPAAKPASAAGHPEAEDRLAVVREIAEHARRVHAALDAWNRNGRDGQVAASFADVGDELFGPWYTFRPVPDAKGKANLLPAYAGEASGAQEWLYVDNWQVMGPRPLGLPAVEAPALPTAFGLSRATWPAARELLRALRPPGEEADAERPKVTWRPWPVDKGAGMLRPPGWRGGGAGYGHVSSGLDGTLWFAATDIHSDRERTLWVAAGADDDAQLWINDRLVAAWPDPGKRTDKESPILFRATFRPGRNPVAVRVRQGAPRGRKAPNLTGFWMRLCTRGAPQKGRTAERTKLSPAPPNVRGWRGNWKGVHPEADPVTAWDAERGINIRWRRSLPASMAAPVVGEKRVFTTAEPHFLVALDKHTGKVAWRRSLDILEVIAPEAASKSARTWDRYYALHAAMHADDGKPRSDGDAPGPITLDGKTLTHDEARSELRQLKRDWRKIAQRPIQKAGHAWKFSWINYLGPICATPVTDGEHIWAWTSHGAAACFDMQGERKWLIELPHEGTSYNAYSSPLLIDGKLIFEVVPEDRKIRGSDMRPVTLLAVDAATGKELWRAPVIEPMGSSSPVAMRISDGSEEMVVIITAGSGCAVVMDEGGRNAEGEGQPLRHSVLGGTVVRADDGKVLVPNMSVNSGYGTPVVDGDVVYHFGPGMGSATQLVMLDRDTVAARRLWTCQTTKGFEPCVSPFNGFLHANLAIPNVGGQGDGGYGVWDADTGRRVPRHVNIDWPLYAKASGRHYVETSVAGGKVFCGDSGEAFGGKHIPQANFTVLEAGPQGRIIAQNGLPPRSNSALAFDGDRFYYRNSSELICVGYTGEEGKAYEAEVNARTILADLPAEAPPARKTVAVAPDGNLHPDLPRQGLWSRPGPPYLLLGPFTKNVREEVVAALTGPERRNLPARRPKDAALTFGGQQREFRFEKDHPHSWSHLVRRGRVRVFHPAGPAFKRNFQLTAPDHSVYVYTVLTCDADRIVRFHSNTENPGVRIWLGGQRMEHHGRYRLNRGEYTLLAELRAGENPNAEDLCLDVLFRPAAATPEGDVKAYWETLETARSYLNRVVTLRPESPTAKHARTVLSKLRSRE